MVKLVIVVLLAAAVQVYDGGAQASRGQTADHVTATVRASGIHAELSIVPARVHVGGMLLGVVSISNVSDQSILVLYTSLVFQSGALTTRLHVVRYPFVLQPHHRIADVWLMQARRAGTLIIVASIATLNSDLSTSHIETAGEIIDVTQR
jgi:hypothetical protein